MNCISCLTGGLKSYRVKLEVLKQENDLVPKKNAEDFAEFDIDYLQSVKEI